MYQAIWKGKVLAESVSVEVIEGNYYFPPDTIYKKYFLISQTHTYCGWKGEASYYDVSIGNDTNRDAAWYYPNPKTGAQHIKNYIAFWKGVEVKLDES